MANKVILMLMLMLMSSCALVQTDCGIYTGQDRANCVLHKYNKLGGSK